MSCPPCSHNCNQGRDCPANRIPVVCPKPESFMKKQMNNGEILGLWDWVRLELKCYIPVEDLQQIVRKVEEHHKIFSMTETPISRSVEKRLRVQNPDKFVDPRVLQWQEKMWGTGEVFRVKITRCPDPLMWYAGLVGKFVKVIRVDNDGLWARENGGTGPINIIRFDDVE